MYWSVILCNGLCLSVQSTGWPAIQLSVLRGKNVDVGYYMQNFGSNFFLAYHVYRYHYLLLFYITFSDWLGVTRSGQSKTSWFHFLTLFSTDQDESWFGAVVIYVEHTDTVPSEI